MLVYLVAALAAGIYLCNVPVRAAAELKLARGGWMHFGVGIFGRARIVTIDKPLSLAPIGKKRRGGKVPWDAIKYAYRHAQIARLHVRLGTGDACHTALLCGAVQAILLPLTRRARVTPVFDAESAQARALCIVDAPLGHIMVAAAWYAASKTVWRVRSWISGRLKAS